jgi:Uma2 family endonuclease
LEAAGLLDTKHLELIEGDLISTVPKNRPHVQTAKLFFYWLVGVFGEQHVEMESPIDVAPKDNGVNQPVPDIIVLSRDYTGFDTTTPRPRDLSLVVEVADTTLDFNIGTKAAIYARAGIADYWVLDIQARRFIVHRDPRDGRYQSVVEYGENDSVSPLAAPDRPFRVGDAFPSR